MSRFRQGSLAFILLWLVGCYRYVPLKTSEPLSGTHITATLTDAGSAELAQYLGQNVASVGGRLVSSSADDLQISVFTVAARDGQESFWKGETVSLPRRLIAGIQQRTFSGSRSGLVATIGLVAGVGLLRALGAFSAGSGSVGGSTATK